MMQGVVNQSCEAILPVLVKNNATTQLVDAVIDTGFSGFLTLPSNIIAALGLNWKGRDVATLGDGTSCIFDVYIAIVIWDEEYRMVDINESETVPLIGMGLLRGYDLRIQAIEGGSVTIAALPKVSYDSLLRHGSVNHRFGLRHGSFHFGKRERRSPSVSKVKPS